MTKGNTNPAQRNRALRKEFKKRQLPLSGVMEFTPNDLRLENQRLTKLLDFIQLYKEWGSFEMMELMTGEYPFAPVYPQISPESDWYRFEEWIQGKPVHTSLRGQIAEKFTLLEPDDIAEADIEAELLRVTQAIISLGVVFSITKPSPARLRYEYLFEKLDESFLTNSNSGYGYWVLDGCTGYCPGCFQRAWCKVGQETCWEEDEAAGKMTMAENAQAFVCASPQSLDILLEYKEEKWENEAEKTGTSSWKNDPGFRTTLN